MRIRIQPCILPDCWYSTSRCISLLPLLLPVKVDSTLQLGPQINPYFLKSVFARVFYHSNRESNTPSFTQLVFVAAASCSDDVSSHHLLFMSLSCSINYSIIVSFYLFCFTGLQWKTTFCVFFYKIIKILINKCFWVK